MSDPCDYLGSDFALDAGYDLAVEEGDWSLVSGMDCLRANLQDQLDVVLGDWAYGLDVGSRTLKLVHEERNANFGVRCRTYAREALGADPRVIADSVKARAAWDGERVKIKATGEVVGSRAEFEVDQELKR